MRQWWEISKKACVKEERERAESMLILLIRVVLSTDVGT